MPTMWYTLAYTTMWTSYWDIDFYVDKTLRTSEQLHQHLLSLKQQAAEAPHVNLLEFTVFDGDREIWKGMV